MFKIILGVLLTIAITIGCAYTQDKKSLDKIHPKYKIQYESTCTIETDTVIGRMLSGTGVLLESGYIITAKHVIDENRNGILEATETSIECVFSNNRKKRLAKKGKVVWMAPNHDFAFIKIDNPPKSTIRLVKSYDAIFIGDRVYTFGYWIGNPIAHMTTGILSTSSDATYGKSTTPVFYGGSGGGLFLERSGRIIGINTRIKKFRGALVSGWTEFVRSDMIYRVLAKNKKLHLVRKATECLRESEIKKKVY